MTGGSTRIPAAAPHALVLTIAMGLCLAPMGPAAVAEPPKPADPRGGAQAVPLEYRLADFADTLRSGKHRLLVLGDSIWTEDATPRLSLGVRDTWAVDFYGWTTMSSPTISDVLASVRWNQPSPLLTPVGVTPRTAFPYTFDLAYGQSFDPTQPSTPTWYVTQPSYPFVSPKPYAEFRFLADQPQGVPIWSARLLAGYNGSPDHFSRFANGSWLSQSFFARIIYHHTPGVSAQRLQVEGYRGGVRLGGVYTYPGPVAGIQWRDVRIDGAGEPMIVVSPTDQVVETPYVGPPPTAPNSLATIIGAHFENPDATRGLSFTVLANSGWTAYSHRSTSVISDESLTRYMEALGVPDLVILQIGANVRVAPPEIEVDAQQSLTPQWAQNIQGVIDRYRTIISGIGNRVSPRFLIVAPYDLGFLRPWVAQEPAVLHQIALSNPDVSFLNLFALTGPWEGLNARYLADQVHPNAAGAVFFPQVIWQALSGGPIGAPIVTLDPVAVVTLPGISTGMHIVASGAQPLTYQWRRNGVPLQDGPRYSGSGTDTLRIIEPPIALNGQFDCVVSNQVGTATSAPATLLVLCLGDLNGNGEIDFQDMNIVLGDFGRTGRGLPGDVNGDGRVDFDDLSVILAYFGLHC